MLLSYITQTHYHWYVIKVMFYVLYNYFFFYVWYLCMCILQLMFCFVLFYFLGKIKFAFSLLDLAKFCQNLQKLARNWQKLAKTGRNWQKLASFCKLFVCICKKKTIIKKIYHQLHTIGMNQSILRCIWVAYSFNKWNWIEYYHIIMEMYQYYLLFVI